MRGDKWEGGEEDVESAKFSCGNFTFSFLHNYLNIVIQCVIFSDN